MFPDESEEYDEEEYDKPGSESGSAGTLGTVLGGLLHGVGLPLGVMISSDEPRDSDAGSIAP